MITHRRTQYVGAFENLTYLPLDEEDLPWSQAPEWDNPCELPDVNMTPATKEVLSALDSMAAAPKVDAKTENTEY